MPLTVDIFILISFESKVHTYSFGKKNKVDQSFFFFIKKYFYWISCFKISFYDDNVNRMSQLTRDHMWKCDKSKYLSNNGSVKIKSLLEKEGWS